ncbi:glutathione S-transferase [Rhodobacter sp. SGA-6-6]|uniref:glutathione S-transferase n=1 Tax=Rhodobacter sp. SGA-6-6 TaxID=2710882 RepID=UPI0013EC5D13|nr:glutathione S-transferase N-terminal domain-containing protein [Rhodobacter sp. SGA-6-6]NGM44468.1 glutathione S-transferase [Rhodobacter sp. SGA-6-6]
MRLFVSPTSPFVRKVVVMIREAGIEGIDTEEVAGNPVAPGSLPVDHNPLGKIPALVLDDGRALYDSRVITRYLDHRAGAGLYPGGERLWDTLALEAMADGMMEAAVLMVYESRIRPEERRHQPWVEAQWLKVNRALDAAETRWQPHLAGPLDMGQIALAVALGYLDFRHDGRGWRQGRPALAAWEAAMAARPALQATVPQG